VDCFTRIHIFNKHQRRNARTDISVMCPQTYEVAA
jgi:hypothetical protein